METKQPRKNRTKCIALGGILAALAIVVMLTGGMLPFATFAAPVFAGVFIMPIAVEIGAKTALLAYVAVSLLSLLMVPDKEMVLFFIFLFGYYPIIQPYLAKIKNKVLRILAQFAIFNAAVGAIYCLLLLVFANPALMAEFTAMPPLFWVFTLLIANVTFAVYNIMVSRLRIVYLCKLRKHIFRQ